MCRVFSRVCICLSVCLSHDISKTDVSKIIKLVTDMVHYESWKTIHFGVKRSKDTVTRRNKTLPTCIGHGALVCAGFFQYIYATLSNIMSH